MVKNLQELNRLITKTYDMVVQVENFAMQQGPFSDLSVTETHTLDAIGKRGTRTMSEVASQLNIAVSTLSVSVSRLIKKGYVERMRDEKDRRVVKVCLTRKGEKAYNLHAYFHSRLINVALGELSEQEEEILISALHKIHAFFDSVQHKCGEEIK